MVKIDVDDALIAEAAEGRGFVGLDVEDREEAGDLDDVADAAGEVEEFQFAFCAFDGAMGDDEFADARAIDVIDIFEVKDDFCMTLLDELLDRAPQDGAALAERDPAAKVHYRDISDLTACAAQNHAIFHR